MAPKGWATEPQKDWLRGWLPAFVTRQAEHKLHLFWPSMHEAWFTQNPEQAVLGLPLPNDPTARALTPDEMKVLGAATVVRKGQLGNWFNNNSKKLGRVDTVSTTSSGVMAAAIKSLFKLGGTPKRTRAHQEIEIFQKRNKALIEAELVAEGYHELTVPDEEEEDDFTDEADGSEAAVKKSLKSQRMRLRTRVVNALWVAASPEEKAAVAAEVEAEKKEMREKELNEEAKETDKKSPTELQAGIDALDTVFSGVQKAAFDASGWVSMTIMGGPNPRMGGEFTLKIVCCGETPAGNDFEDCCVNFDGNVLEPFEGFLRQTYTAEQRAACAFPTVPSTSDAPRIPRAVPPPPPPAVAPKPKKKTGKKKKTAAAAAVPVPSPQSTVASSTTATDAGFETGPGDLTSVAPEPMETSSVVPEVDFADDIDTGPAGSSEEDISPFFEDAAHTNNDGQLWPAGMTPPLSPSDAAALAAIERGHPGAAGEGDGPTFAFAIDPALQQGANVSPSPPGVSSPSLPQPASRPTPRGAYRGAEAATVQTAHVNGFNFPLPAPKAVPSVSHPASDSPYRKPFLFEAFRRVTPATPSTPTRLPIRPPPYWPVSLSAPGTPSRTALALAQLIGIKAATTPIAGSSAFGSGVAPPGNSAMRTAPIGDKSTTPTPLFGGIPQPIVTASSPPASVTTPPFFSASPPIFRASSPPASVTTPPKHRRPKSVADMSPTSSSSTAGGIMQPSTPLPAALVTAAVLAAAIVTPPPVPVATATSAPLPAVSAPPPSASNAAGTHGTVSTPAVVLPGSRPATKPVKAPAKKAPAKAKTASGKGRKAPAKKVAMAEAGEKESAAGAAKKAADSGKKPRGRPRKVADTPAPAAEVVAGTSGSAAPLADTTNAEPVYVTTHNNRARARQAALADAAKAAQDVADAAARQAAKGWIDTTKNGGPTTIVLTRARKPNKYADGTLIPQIPNPHAKTEAALLARAAKGTSTASKRKAPAQAGNAAKKRK
ncbi:hypothetical protein C8R47DRAFT_1216657 [Mycena vitilis]|nr:hypothetical protein C8R47DRAFT_1216657 [Mycena vitilis]